ncbi:GPW/gp25 family protein [Gelidibacter salicanalis]|uniref:GPW/gp25 family protein n=1 Tax=Gelidibacter salicanalis TaxID=291193 RepID=A0A5C7AGE5_9FLAO|nr:GPW/gp25 family protein [Gelidibacter salicanalis]TXE07856.1 GPW/gp25 family protein [Gelidibacter salicanalis]
MTIKYPYQFNKLGRTATSDEDLHIKDMIYQLLFTNPGERVNRPNFGCGLLQAVFEPNNNEMAATTQYLVQGALNQWLSHLIQVNEVFISTIDSSLEVKVNYTLLRNKKNQTIVFQK